MPVTLRLIGVRLSHFQGNDQQPIHSFFKNTTSPSFSKLPTPLSHSLASLRSGNMSESSAASSNPATFSSYLHSTSPPPSPPSPHRPSSPVSSVCPSPRASPVTLAATSCSPSKTTKTKTKQTQKQQPRQRRKPNAELFHQDQSQTLLTSFFCGSQSSKDAA